MILLSVILTRAQRSSRGCAASTQTAERAVALAAVPPSARVIAVAAAAVAVGAVAIMTAAVAVAGPYLSTVVRLLTWHLMWQVKPEASLPKSRE